MGRATRGAALAEAALVIPAMVAVVMGAAIATQLMLARLEVQEAARFGAWRLTARPTPDSGAVEREARRRYPLKAPFVIGTGVELALEDAPAGVTTPPAWHLSSAGRADAVTRAEVSGVALEERASVIADPWDLPDGGDDPPGLRRQVARMTSEAGPIPDLRSLGLPSPDTVGPFVVSRGYRPARRSACRGLPGYPADALGGLVDLGDRLDAPQPRCFDTAPFRDTQEYAASLGAQLYRMRREREATP